MYTVQPADNAPSFRNRFEIRAMPPRTTDDRAPPAAGLTAGRTTTPPLRLVLALLVGAGDGLNLTEQAAPRCPYDAWSGGMLQGPLTAELQAVGPFATNPQCRLAIIMAGVPRGGSTAQLRWLRTALHTLGVTEAHHSYWNFHWHDPTAHFPNGTRAYVAALNATVASFGNDDVVLFKTHEYDPRLWSMCRQQVVFTTHRNPVDMMRSANRAGWFPPHWQTASVFRHWSVQQLCWAERSVEDTAYEDVLSFPDTVYRRIAHTLVQALETTPPPDLAVPTTLRHEANAAIPHTAAQGVPMRWLGFEAAAEPWVQRYGYEITIPSQDCDSERWLFVVATGRSGSTSLLTMLNELPGVYLAGENGGVLPSLYALHLHADETQYWPRTGAWQHRAIDETQLRTVARQYVKAAIGMDPLQRYSMIGFKEIRYATIEQLEYLFQLFPCSKAVVNYRLDLQAQYASARLAAEFVKDAKLRERTDMYLDWARRHPTRIRTVALEELSLQSMDALAAWLGFERCHYTCLNHANRNGTYAPDPLRCLRCVPTL